MAPQSTSSSTTVSERPDVAGRYMRQLDSLRTFAVAAVILSHAAIGTWIANVFPWGPVGVELFFVLSGFLITGILLHARADADSGVATWGEEIRRFYLRRALRIAPVFYATLFAMAVLNVPPVRQTLLWNVTYLSNVYFVRRGAWHGSISHLWSLAVEEQFYLVWPWLILLVPVRHLKKVIVAAIAIGPLYRLVCLASGFGYLAAEALPFGCLDLLGYGALLAMWRREKKPVSHIAGRAALFAGLPLAILAYVLALHPSLLAASVTIGRSARAMLFGWLVVRAAEGFGGVAGKFLSLPPLVYLGKISYAIYLFHNFVPGALPVVLRLGFGATLPESHAAQALISVATTVILAMISWRYFEGPLNRLKERFQTPRLRTATVATAAAVLFAVLSLPLHAQPPAYHLELQASPAAAFPYLGKFGDVALHVYPHGVRADALWLDAFSRNGQSFATVMNPFSRMYIEVPMSQIATDLANLAGAAGSTERAAAPTMGPTLKGKVKGIDATRYRLVYGPQAWIDVWTTTTLGDQPQVRQIISEIVRGISPATAQLSRTIPGVPLYVELNFRRFKKVPIVTMKTLTFDAKGEEEALKVGAIYFKAPVGAQVLTK